MSKRLIKRIVVIGATVAVSVALLLVFLLNGKVEAELSGTKPKVSSYYLGREVHYTFIDISDFEIGTWENFADGAKQSGTESSIISAGRYSGGYMDCEYNLHRYNNVKTVIILRPKDPYLSPLVFNLKTEKDTMAFYSLLESRQ